MQRDASHAAREDRRGRVHGYGPARPLGRRWLGPGSVFAVPMLIGTGIIRASSKPRHEGIVEVHGDPGPAAALAARIRAELG